MLSQIKYWVFGLALAVAIFLIVQGAWPQWTQVAVGLALAAGSIGAFSLGAVWDAHKQAEKAATWEKLKRDEEARQRYVKVASDGAKQLEAPQAPSVLLEPAE